MEDEEQKKREAAAARTLDVIVNNQNNNTNKQSNTNLPPLDTTVGGTTATTGGYANRRTRARLTDAPPATPSSKRAKGLLAAAGINRAPRLRRFGQVLRPSREFPCQNLTFVPAANELARGR